MQMAISGEAFRSYPISESHALLLFVQDDRLTVHTSPHRPPAACRPLPDSLAGLCSRPTPPSPAACAGPAVADEMAAQQPAAAVMSEVVEASPAAAHALALASSAPPAPAPADEILQVADSEEGPELVASLADAAEVEGPPPAMLVAPDDTQPVAVVSAVEAAEAPVPAAAEHVPAVAVAAAAEAEAEAVPAEAVATLAAAAADVAADTEPVAVVAAVPEAAAAADEPEAVLVAVVEPAEAAAEPAAEPVATVASATEPEATCVTAAAVGELPGDHPQPPVAVATVAAAAGLDASLQYVAAEAPQEAGAAGAVPSAVEVAAVAATVAAADMDVVGVVGVEEVDAAIQEDLGEIARELPELEAMAAAAPQVAAAVRQELQVGRGSWGGGWHHGVRMGWGGSGAVGVGCWRRLGG